MQRLSDLLYFAALLKLRLSRSGPTSRLTVTGLSHTTGLMVGAKKRLVGRLEIRRQSLPRIRELSEYSCKLLSR
jgi:hypothetical protein